MTSTRRGGPEPPPPSRRRALGVLGGASAAALLGGCAVKSIPTAVSDVGLSKHPAPGRKHTIEVYNNQGAPTGQGVVLMAKEFERTHPDIGVRVTYSPIVGSDTQPKLLTAIASGKPPDVGMIGLEYAPMWSRLAMMTDLTPHAKAAALTPGMFEPVAAKLMWQDGTVWGMQWEGDPNFPFFWNKDLFEKSGLDPERPPRTIDEVDEMSKHLNRRKGSLITQIGMVPWDTYKFANSMYTWGFAFGGSFFDKERNVLTPDQEYNVKALEWMTRYAKSAGGVNNLATTPPGLTMHPFGGGHIGMTGLVAANYQAIRTAVPKMRIGTGLLPYQPPGADRPGQGAWLGGWSFFVPKGAADEESAWEFIRWSCASKPGTDAVWKDIGYLPVLTDSPGLAASAKSTDMRPYFETLKHISNVRPAVPSTPVLANALEKFVSQAVYGQTSAVSALRSVKEVAMDEWKRFNRQVGDQASAAKAAARLRRGRGWI